MSLCCCNLQRMAQGSSKHKAKGGAPPTKKTKGKAAQNGVTKNGNIKKGKFTIAPKKQVTLFMTSKYPNIFLQHHQAAFKFKAHVKKTINLANEKEIKEKAQVFESKPFQALNSEAGASAT